jgi:hypothetical protein
MPGQQTLGRPELDARRAGHPLRDPRLSSNGPIAGWWRRSWKTETKSIPAASALRAIAS